MAWTTPTTVAAGEVLTAALWTSDVQGNTLAVYEAVRRLGYQQRTSNYTIDQTALASAADIFSSDITWTATGATYLVEFYAPFLSTGASSQWAIVDLVTGTGTGIGTIAKVYSNSGITQSTVFGRYFYTPSAGSVSINARGVKSGGGNGEIGGGSGGTAAEASFPAYLAVYGPILT